MLRATDVDKEDSIQEAEYGFPYHYIPERTESKVTLVRSWHWGLKYLAGIEVIMEMISREPFNSLIEVGCGDGRLLREVSVRFPGKMLQGVDYSLRAIELAKAFNPNLDFQVVDVTKEAPTQTFDVVLLSEVLEHIHPGDIKDFLHSLSVLMDKDSRMVITVPHSNLRVIPKHFQHFTLASLQEMISSHFSVVHHEFFDAESGWFKRVKRLLMNRHYVILNHRVTRWLLKQTIRMNASASEQDCLRLAVVCRKNSTN